MTKENPLSLTKLMAEICHITFAIDEFWEENVKMFKLNMHNLSTKIYDDCNQECNCQAVCFTECKSVQHSIVNTNENKCTSLE